MSRLKLWLALAVLIVIALAVGITLSSNPSAQDTNINAGPTFTYTINNGTISLSAANGYADYSWDFGDGSTGRGAIVSHTYGTGGNYTVTLTASPLNGSTSLSTYQQIAITSVTLIIHHYFENLNVTMGNAAS